MIFVDPFSDAPFPPTTIRRFLIESREISEARDDRLQPLTKIRWLLVLVGANVVEYMLPSTERNKDPLLRLTKRQENMGMPVYGRIKQDIKGAINANSKNHEEVDVITGFEYYLRHLDSEQHRGCPKHTVLVVFDIVADAIRTGKPAHASESRRHQLKFCKSVIDRRPSTAPLTDERKIPYVGPYFAFPQCYPDRSAVDTPNGVAWCTCHGSSI